MSTAPEDHPSARRTPPGTRRRPVLVLCAVLVLAVLGGLLVLDQARLHDEQAASRRCAGEAQAADTLARTRFSSTAQYVAPTPTTSAPILLADAAEKARPGIAKALAACEDVEIRAWHPGTRSRRDDVVAYLAARLRALDTIAADGAGYYDGGSTAGELDELERLRSRAFAEAGVSSGAS